ncbi:DMT family transporter [Halalkalibacterium halodurans]|jgi:drug/metabolite transporter (DMT)-like permease|uniref:BH0390 protein n=2 Tax=Halalkalibacterium halodurans TaxID=86665 RepID=Q9KFT7_HALH5|nr:DMT family transporter [Halalkalibacterium halodurans]MDY7220883.1 DMT family transporter [Halalkalibacterium halodurans]MDY7240122.1 DMT family transporter [Halalkalibacterium halodurans]MED4082561.1 DMT family transporter [Halalkalibacterium halodurans]MED4085806.1 DMT family transporter [Halalkalibacterium halodurans]MED4105672.1 DMT family transporter [Halalkalibacterium halodurans]
MNQTISAQLKIMFAMVIVGSSVVAGKMLVESFPVFLASELRFLIAALILVPMLLKKEGIPTFSKKEVGILFLQALSGVFLFSIFMLYGLMYTTAMEGGIIMSTLPAVVALMAFITLKEKLTRLTIIGILLAVGGTLAINTSGTLSDVERGVAPLLGNLLIIGAVISEALFIIFGKSISQRVSPLAISTMVSVFGVVLFLPFAIYEATRFPLTDVSLNDWLIIFYFGVVVTVIAFVLMYQGIEKVPASTVGVLTGVLPISAVLLSALILKESFSTFHVAGMGLVLAAILLISIDSNVEKKEVASLKKKKGIS